MKKILFILILSFCYLSVKSQEVKDDAFEIGLRYLNVNTSWIGSGSNQAFGVSFGYRNEFGLEKNLSWISRIGFDYSPECTNPENCNSWWFSKNLWVSSEIERKVNLSTNTELGFGLGYALFYGPAINSQGGVFENGNLVSVTYITQPTVAHGPILSGRFSPRKISKELSFSYSLVVNVLDRFRTGIHSFGLIYRIPQKGRKYYEE